MPAQVLHTLLGEDALAAAGPSPWPLDSPAFRLYALGCQGPDLFYHNQVTRPVAIEYGTLLHRRGYGRFSAALLRRCAVADAATASAGGCAGGPEGDSERRPESAGCARDMEALQGRRYAYALGFATHAALDRAIHPYIVYKAGWVAPSRPETARYARCHAFFERVLDVLMLRRLRNADISSWPQTALLAEPCDAAAGDPGLLSASIAAALVDAYPERAGRDDKLPSRLSSTFTDAGRFYRATDPKALQRPAPTASADRAATSADRAASSADRAATRASVALLYPINLTDDLDYLNLRRAAWEHPCPGSGSDDRSVPELFAAATAEAAAILRLALPAAGLLAAGGPEAEALEESLATLIGVGGLSVNGPDGLPCAPKRSDPFPLDSLLDAQYALRLGLTGP